jgi:hypothetical protein
MRMVEKRFRCREDVKTIWFNAWAYGRDEPIGLALLQPKFPTQKSKPAA